MLLVLDFVKGRAGHRVDERCCFCCRRIGKFGRRCCGKGAAAAAAAKVDAVADEDAVAWEQPRIVRSLSIALSLDLSLLNARREEDEKKSSFFSC